MIITLEFLVLKLTQLLDAKPHSMVIGTRIHLHPMMHLLY
jgi:hypothetical protein